MEEISEWFQSFGNFPLFRILLNSFTKVKIKVEFPVFMNSFDIKSVPSFLLFCSRFIPFFISLQLKGKSKGEGVWAAPRVGSALVKSLETSSSSEKQSTGPGL